MEENKTGNSLNNKIIKTKWYQENRGVVIILLNVLLLVTAWHRFFLAIILLLIILFFKKSRNLGTFLLVGAYSGFLTLVNIVVYIANNRNIEGNFEVASGTTPIWVYLAIYVGLVIFLIKTYKNKS